MKRRNNSQHARRDLLGALDVLRQLTKEVGGNCLASLHAEVTSVDLPSSRSNAQRRRV